MRSKLQTSRSGESRRECQFFSRLMPDLKWEIISRKSPMQGLKSRMSYLPRVAMITLLVLSDEYNRQTVLQSTRAFTLPSTSIRTRLACPIPSSFDALKTLFLRRRKLNTVENSQKQLASAIDFLGNLSVTYQ